MNGKRNTQDDLEIAKNEIEVLRRYITACPELPGSSRAIRAALNGLEKESQRINRDQKLKAKFTKSSNDKKSEAMEDLDTEIVDWNKESSVGITKNNNDTQVVDDSTLMEWQDIHSPNSDIAPGSTFEESVLGKKLAEIALSKIVAADAKVSDDLSAIALVLHSALLSEFLGFKCTGVPEPETKKNNGFAKPIRELPKNKFVPDEFYSSENRNSLLLRYRKKETGSMILKVTKTIDNEANVNIQFAPTITQPEPNPQGPLVFCLSDHLNLDSFFTAITSAQKHPSSKSSMVLPTLHFKRLPQLLSNFAKSFDVGPVNELSFETQNSDANAMRSEQIDTNTMSGTTTSSSGPPFFNRNQNQEFYSLKEVKPLRRPGDFETDLSPAVLFPSSNVPIYSSGNLMGPNHSMFHQAYPDDDDGYDLGPNPFQPQIGGLGMQPRFDPFGPPGGPTAFRRARGRGRGNGRNGRGNRGGTFQGGDPNNDHQRPPQNLDHMFM